MFARPPVDGKPTKTDSRLNTSAHQPTKTALRSPMKIVSRDPVSVKSYINFTRHIIFNVYALVLLFITNININFDIVLHFSLKYTVHAKWPSSF